MAHFDVEEQWAAASGDNAHTSLLPGWTMAVGSLFR
jgi:hypothetical protein